MQNRTLKFRAWDKIKKQMVSGYEAFDESCGWQNDDTGNHIVLRQDKYQLMQFTGLTDRNGKEIYEGDIVRLDGIDHNYAVLYTGVGFSLFLDADGDEWVANDLRLEDYIRSYLEYNWIYGNYSVQVIGNIFQDIHLLDKPKNNE